MSLGTVLSGRYRVSVTKTAESVDARLIGLMRFVLALSALLIIFIDPSEPERLVELTYVSLSAYCVYSLALCISILRERAFIPRRAQHWLDVAVYVCLIALTQGTSSIFFFFFFFAILVASFSRGYFEGLAVTITSVVLFTVVGLLSAPSGAAFELDRALIRPIYLFLLGYMMAYWGGREILLRRRLALLRDVGSLANPRFGIEATVARSLRQLVNFFEADACILVCAPAGSQQYHLYRVDASKPASMVRAQPLTDESAHALLGLPPALSASFDFRERRASWLNSGPVTWTQRTWNKNIAVEEQCQRLANLLETSALATAPYRQQEGTLGRVFLMGTRAPLSPSDTEFLGQAVDQIAACIDNLTLLDELMVNAAKLERSRISRDIHDTTIQPYIGLKLALEALHRSVDARSPIAGQIKELLDMANSAVADLRAYVAQLRESTSGWPGETLLESIREQIQRYLRFYSIQIELRAVADLQLTDRVAAEAYQIVCEALSNVHRHTQADVAFVDLRCQAEVLIIEVGNERPAGAPRLPFTPRSICDRAAALGGRTEVRLDDSGYDTVRVAVPL